MSIIAIKGIPLKCGLLLCAQMFKRVIGGPFETLTFGPQSGGKGTKTLYLKLPEKMDPKQIVDKINTPRNKEKGLLAYVPEHVPDLKLTATLRKRKEKERSRSSFRQDKVIVTAYQQLFSEIQYRFPGFFRLSLNTNHKLLNEIALVIGDRLKQIFTPGNELSSSEATRTYRSNHPHSEDFQLILTTLHRLQDEAGAPRLQLEEKEISSRDNLVSEDNLPREKIEVAYSLFAQRAAEAVIEHINSFEDKVSPEDNEMMVERKKVRGELKKMVPYFGVTMLQLAEQHFSAPQELNRRMRIYGIPSLPSDDILIPFASKYAARNTGVTRALNMYNVLRMAVHSRDVHDFMAMDGTVLNGATLLIRDSEVPLRNPPEDVCKSLVVHCGGDVTAAFNFEDNDDDLLNIADETTDMADEPTKMSDEITMTDELTQMSDEPSQMSDEQSQMSDEPTHMSDVPTQMSDEPTQHAPDEPTHMSDDPNQISVRPTHVSDVPTEMFDQPTDAQTHLSDEPTHMSDEPKQHFSEESARISNEPTQMPDGPTHLSDEPIHKSDVPTQEPTKISDGLIQMSDVPTQMSDEATQMSNEPTQMSNEPTKISDQPTQLSHEPTQDASNDDEVMHSVSS